MQTTTVSDTFHVLTPKGRAAVALARLRDCFDSLPAPDQERLAAALERLAARTAPCPLAARLAI